MTITNQDLFHMLFQRQRMIEKSVNRTLAAYDLYSSQWSILFCLHKFGPMVQTDIWKYLGVEAPTVTRTIRRMEENGWIERETGEDKRARIVRLTDYAQRIYPDIEEAMRRNEERLLASCTEEEKATLYAILQNIQ